MNVESKPTSTATITKTTDTVTNSTAISTATADGKSFKDELQTTAKNTDEVKAKDALTLAKQTAADRISTDKITEANTAKSQRETIKEQTAIITTKTETENSQKLLNQQDTAVLQNVSQALTGEIGKNKLADEKSSKKFELNSEAKNATDPLSALTETINTLKSNVDLKTNSITSKSTFKIEEKCSSEITLKMDDKDVSFFLNLVQSDQMTAQIVQTTGAAANTSNQITEIKTQATQQPVQVSAVLLDALSQSSQTGKSVRIDFDDNIAVVMKLDKNGVISANFIPGDTAVENYLRNNISILQQSFNDKNIAYNELTYSKQQKQQQEQQKNKDKEQENE